MSYLSDRAEIQDLNTTFAVTFDNFELEKCVNCWTKDGILDEREIGFALYDSRNAIRDFFRDSLFANAKHVIHIMFSHLISEIKGNKAKGRAYALVEVMMNDGTYRRAHTLYIDEYVKKDGQWKFKSRVIRSSFPHDAMAD